MIDIEGLFANAEDLELIAHPQIGGVILFSRNYQNLRQLKALVAQLRKARQGDLLIAVDHEGGRVQRFKDEFTAIPAMATFGARYTLDAKASLQALRETARLMACELIECELDFTFAPVVDLDHGLSAVIGDRALHNTVDGVVDLARALIDGFDSVGCASVLKHFPGHGSVVEDTHLDFAHDTRSYDAIAASDQLPFQQLANTATAMMSSHVVYDAIDKLPASLSRIWLTDILRSKLGFTGAVISDDLTMAAVAKLGSVGQSTRLALDAGSDLILICNDRGAVTEALDDLGDQPMQQASLARRLKLKRNMAAVLPDADELAATREFIVSMA